MKIKTALLLVVCILLLLLLLFIKKLNRKKILVFSFLSFQSTGHLVVVIGVLRIIGF